MALATCIDDVCAESKKVVTALNQGQTNVSNWMSQAHRDLESAQQQVQALLVAMSQEGHVLDCVINGAAGKTCTTNRGVTHLTLAEALTRLNACSITSVTEKDFTATAGQTTFTLPSAPATPAAIEVYINGACAMDPSDYTIVGNTLTFSDPLLAGDIVQTRTLTP